MLTWTMGPVASSGMRRFRCVPSSKRSIAVMAQCYPRERDASSRISRGLADLLVERTKAPVHLPVHALVEAFVEAGGHRVGGEDAADSRHRADGGPKVRVQP